MIPRAAAACVVLFAAASVHAAELRVQVRTPAGAPAANAVVTAYPAQGDYAPRPSAAPLVMAQEDKSFKPYVLVAPVGTVVSFPNHDTVRHHVYSFSPAHRFELKLYGKEEHRTETFAKAGIVAIGCNIHDRMAAYVDVVDTRFAAKTDAAGVAAIDGLPAGPVRLKVWHPLARSPAPIEAAAVVGGPAPAPVVVDLRPPPPGKQAG